MCEQEDMPVFKFRMREVVRVIGDAEESVVHWRRKRRDGRNEYYLRRDWAKRSLWWPECLLERLVTNEQALAMFAQEDSAVAAAVAAEREAISAQLLELADELGYGSSWWGPPGGLLLRAADMVSARAKP